MTLRAEKKQEEIARFIAKHNGRSSLIARKAQIKPLMAKRFYEEVNGKSARSGLAPDSIEWSFQPIHRIHASLLLSIYDKVLERTNDDTLAFLSTYSTYSRLCKGNLEFDINRWHCLHTQYTTGRRLVKLKLSTRSEIDWAKCKVCKSKVLIQAHEIKSGFECPYCNGSVDRSRALTGTHHQKKLNHALGGNHD